MNIHNEISARLAIVAFNIQEAKLEEKPGYSELEKVYNPLLEKFDLPSLKEANYDNDGVMINTKPEVREAIQAILNLDDIEKTFKETSISDLIEYNEWALQHYNAMPPSRYTQVLRLKIQKNILALLSDGVTALI